ncbi:MAG TPA: zf-HC2 domain-containing protein [Pyrinomonadaceae bacterium]|nr:zf-HC2 domain-containing protein [Pyrinomonadaceae bacterium]
MTKRCLDEAVIQAYLDGELSPDSTKGALAHFAACEGCSAALADAMSESAFFAEAFGPDESLAVPTEVLRANVTAAVARLESADGAQAARKPGWSLSSMLAPLAGLLSFNPRQAAAFASVLAVVAFAAIFFIVQRQAPQQPASPEREVARHDTAEQRTPKVTPPDAPADSVIVDDDNAVGPVGGVTPSGGRFVKAAGSKAAVRARSSAAPKGEAKSRAKAKDVVPGEQNYLQAIASLEQTIKLGGEAVLTPSVRAQYERNLAVINKAIEETRGVAARDPKDKDAVGFLLTAYQSKVELLSTVADQAQVAALGR